MNILNREVEAINGVKIPQVGFGVYKINDEKEFEKAVGAAIDAGYRHFDTAKIYGNEQNLGSVIKKSNIPREEFFITSKVWNTDLGYEATKKAFYETCLKLNVDYLDMYLIHFAAPNYIEAWRAMEELYLEGKIKVIGVANFEIQHLEKLMINSNITPMINQIETHPEFPQNELHEYLKKHRILHEAWAPLGQGNKALLHNSELAKIASKHNKSVAQIILRWHIERGVTVIPKSSNQKRIKENFELFDFVLSVEDMKEIDKLNTNTRYSHSPTGYMINPIYNKLMKIFIK